MLQSYTVQHRQQAQQLAASRQANGLPQCHASPAGKTGICTQHCSNCTKTVPPNNLFIYTSSYPLTTIHYAPKLGELTTAQQLEKRPRLKI